MAGIDKILSEIQTDAEREADSILSKAKAEAATISEKAAEECSKLESDSLETLRQKESERAGRIASMQERILKLKTLEAKQTVIEGVLRDAREKLLSLPDGEYLDMCLKLLDESVQSEDGELCMNERDLGRVNSNFSDAVSRCAAEHGGSLKLSDEPVQIDGGFILKYGKIEINSSIESLFDEKRDSLVDVISRTMW